MRRSRSGLILVLLALLLIGGGIWLLGGSEPDDPSSVVAYDDDETRIENGGALEAEQLEGHARLAGVGPKTAKPVKHLPPGPVVVAVRGPLGHAIPHLDIVVGSSMRVLTKEQAAKEGIDPNAAPKQWDATTDSEGKAYFEELPRDGSVFVRRATGGGAINRIHRDVAVGFLLTVLTKDGQSIITPHIAGSGTPIVGESVRLDLPAGIPARVVAVDAGDGAPADASLMASPGLDAKGQLAGLVDGRLFFAASPGRQHTLHPVRKTSDLYVPTKRGSFRTTFSPAAKVFEARVPIRRSTEVSVTLPPEIDTQQVQKWTLTWSSAGARGKAEARLDSYSRLLATGVPYTPGASVTISAKLPGQGSVWASGRFEFNDSVLVLEGRFKPLKKRKASASPPRVGSGVRAARADRLRRAAERLEKSESAVAKLEIRLAEASEAREGKVNFEIVQRAAEAAAVSVQGRVLVVDGTQMWNQENGSGGAGFGRNGEWFLSNGSKGSEDNLGSVRVEVTTPALERARGALVYVGGRSGKTNDRGVALFEKMKPGTYPVRVFGAGAPVTGEVTVVAKRTATVSLSAPEGGRIEVVFEDEHGRALPFSSLTIKQPSGMPYADVDDNGIQRLDMYADAQGRRTLHSVEPGTVAVIGRYAGRTVNQTVDVVDLETTTIKLSIPLEKRAPSAKQQIKARSVELDVAKAALEQLMHDVARKRGDGGR